MLFGKRKRELPPLITDDELRLVSALSYDTVLEWLVGLSDEDFEKIGQVASIYRKADEDAAKKLGKPNEPISYIDPPKSAIDSEEIPFVLDGDEKLKINKKPKS